MMIYHVVSLTEWEEGPEEGPEEGREEGREEGLVAGPDRPVDSDRPVSFDRPYAPASLATDGFVHCSPDEETTLAVADAFYRGAPRPLLALVLDVERLTARCAWEAADPAPPPGVAEDTLFPHVFGPLDRAAVTRVLEVRWDAEGRAVGLTDRH